METLSNTDLVKLLIHPNGWHRDMAQRVLGTREADQEDRHEEDHERRIEDHRAPQRAFVARGEGLQLQVLGDGPGVATPEEHCARNVVVEAHSLVDVEDAVGLLVVGSAILCG